MLGIKPWDMERFTPAELTAISDWAAEREKA